MLDVCCSVQAVQQFLVLQVFDLLLSHVLLLIDDLLVVVCQVLCPFPEFALHLQVDHLAIVDADRALQRFGPDHFVNQIHGLLGQHHRVDSLLNVEVGVDVLQGFAVRVSGLLLQNQQFGLVRGAGLDFIESAPCNSNLLRGLLHLLLSLEGPEVLLVRYFCGLSCLWALPRLRQVLLVISGGLLVSRLP